MDRLAGYEAWSKSYDSWPQDTCKRWQVGRQTQVQKDINFLYFTDIHLETEGAAGANGLYQIRAFLVFLAHSRW